MKAVNIIWDTDGYKVKLPKKVEFPADIEEDDFDVMDDYLSDTYGYFVKSYDVEYTTKNKFLIVFQDRDNKIYYLNNIGGVSEIIDNKILFSTLEKYAMWYNGYPTAKTIETKMRNCKLPKTNSFDIISSACIRYDYIIEQKIFELPINIEF